MSHFSWGSYFLPKAKSKVIEIVSHHEIFKHSPLGFKEPLAPDYNLLQKPSFYCQLPVTIKSRLLSLNKVLNKSVCSSSRKYMFLKQPWKF